MAKFSLQEKVFVKMRGFPHWPAVVEGIADETPKKIKYHIYFYGTKQIAVCKEKDLVSYVDNVHKYGTPKKYKHFNKAVAQMNDELGISSENVKKSSDKDAGYKITANLQSSCEKLCRDSNKLKDILKLESKLLEIELEIHGSLTLQKADPKKCIKCLDELSMLKLSPLIIKKHPDIIDTLNKLQHYIGNTNNWNMSSEEIEEFSNLAETIRRKGKLVLDKIKNLFNVPKDKKFKEVFENELKFFENLTDSMSPEEFFRLVTDPSKPVVLLPKIDLKEFDVPH